MDIARFQEMYKNRGFGASLQQRVENLNKQRQTSRNIVMMKKRKIDEGTLAPITSPLVANKNTKRQPQVAAEENRTDHRLEMLKKWQEDKKKRSEKQKVNKKPLFKVQHIATSSRYDLDRVYKQIKGIVTFPKKKKASQEQPRQAPSSTNPMVQNENVQGNGKTESVPPDSTDEDEEVFLPNAVKATHRKEFHRRNLRGGSDSEKSTNSKAAAAYFYELVNNQTDRLRVMCQEWNLYKDKHKPKEEVCDMISVTVGQTNLLLNKKFQQFRGLVESCETGNSEKPVNFSDLQGFWDMVMIQVGNLDERFENLEKLKKNAWEEILPIIKAKQKYKPKKRAVEKPSTSSTSSLRAAIQEARRKKSAEPQPSTIEEELCMPSTSTKTPEFRKTRRSKAKRSISSSPLIIMKVTQAAKSAEKSQMVTPQNSQRKNSPKSILKSQRAKSAERKSEVLFEDNETLMDNENQDNDQNSPNLTSSNPPGKTKRRSRRLAKS